MSDNIESLNGDNGLEITARLDRMDLVGRSLGSITGYRLIDNDGVVFVLEQGTNTLGRLKRANNIVLKDRFCSAVHAEIMNEEAALTLTDLGSTNGTYVNGIKLAPAANHPLVPGDEISLGHTQLRVEAIRDDES